MIARSLSVLLSTFGLATAAAASATPAFRAEQPEAQVRARLLAEHLNLAPGKRSWLAIEFAISPGWHMYWKGQNDTGLPPQLEFQLPPDFKVGEVLWPVPERHISPGDLVDSIVHEQLTLLIAIDVPVNAKPGTSARIGINSEWLVCKESCILESTALEVTLPIRDTTPAAQPDPKATGVFASARERLPRRWPKDEPPASIEWRDSQVLIRANDATEVIFHPDEGGIALESVLKEGAAKGRELRFRLKTPAAADQRLLGVLEIRKEGKKPEFYSVSLPQPAAKSPG